MDASVPDRLLYVDLTQGDTAWKEVPDRWIRRFVGGKGLGARYLYDAIDAETDPLGGENVLLLLVGPLTGFLPDGGRFAAVTKSPLTGLFLDSYAGGSFGPALRSQYPEAAGIVVAGKSADTHLLDLRTEDPRLRPAPEIADEPLDVVEGRYPDAAVLAVGPAGEHGVSFATIACDGGAHHAGRGGAGAVMGTKGLKAVLLPDERHEVAEPALVALREETREAFAESAYGRAYRSAGTLESVEFADALEMLPTRGWQERGFDGTEGLGIEAVEALADEREDDDEVYPGDYRVRGDDYETVLRGGTPMTLGAGLGLDDVDEVSRLGATCDRLGLDVISGGSVIGLAILANRAGTIDRDLAFGDADRIRELLVEIAYRETSLGSTLAEGVEAAGHELGLTDAIPTVKAMAVPAYDPRGAPAMALAYATSDRGACHRRSVLPTAEAFREDSRPRSVASAIAAEQDRRALHWCLIVDDVADPMTVDLCRRWLGALGLQVDESSLQRVGTRTWTMTRLFNVREGADRAADTLPEQFRHGADGIAPDSFERALEEYYAIREWDVTGRPTSDLLARLDLDGVVDDEAPVDDPAGSFTRTGAGE